MADLNSPGIPKALAKRILEDIDEHCIELYDDGHRTHLGASLIGDECKRKLWYVFRWVQAEKFKSSKTDATPAEHKANHARMQRLFNRGHKEEDRYIEWLEGIGVKVWADDLTNNTLWFNIALEEYKLLPKGEKPDIEKPSNPVWKDVSDGKYNIAIAKLYGLEFPQYRISAVNGHFGGSLDGIAKLPERYQINEPVLLEFKTINEKGHKKLEKSGVAVEKPQHYAQMSTYGVEYGLNYALYMSVHKDSDTIYAEIVKLNHRLGEEMKLKAEQIIRSIVAPPKLSQNPTLFKCKFCSYSDICHKGAICEKNCRSCKHAMPAEQKQWVCTLHNDIIPKDFIPLGCSEYEAITNNV